MSNWAGFTEDELRGLKHEQYGEALEAEGKSRDNVIKKSALNNGARKSRPREKIRRKNDATAKPRNAKESGSDREKLVDKTERELLTPRPKEENTELRGIERENSSPECERIIDCTKQTEAGGQEKSPGLEPADLKETQTPEMILEPERIQAIELSALQKLQQKQKEIEEQNKIKKAALQATIKQRYRKTQTEAQTLKIVQKELSHLDTLLSTDVAILRDTIEEATRDYTQAQKRYERAEAEFVESKIDLHRKTERKEVLTEHLYAIIQENEQRKANKLEELMAKLNLSEADSQYSTEHSPNIEVKLPFEGKMAQESVDSPKQITEVASQTSDGNKTCDSVGETATTELQLDVSVDTQQQQQQSPQNC